MKKSGKGLGILAFIIGLISLVFSLIPFLGLIVSIVAITLCILAIKKESAKTLAIIGLIFSIISIIVGGFMIVLLILTVKFSSLIGLGNYSGAYDSNATSNKQCYDGTPLNTCVFERSNQDYDKWLYCNKRKLIYDCSLCGCPYSSTCLTNGSCAGDICYYGCVISTPKCFLNYTNYKTIFAEDIFSTCEINYDKIKSIINSSRSPKIILQFCNDTNTFCKTVAGYAYGDQIYLNNEIGEQNPKNLRGVMIHEITHVFQTNFVGNPRPDWVIEGVADYVSSELNGTGSYFYGCYENETYLVGYQCAAAFIRHLKPLCKGDIVQDLSIEPYHYNFATRCGDTVENLWINYPDKNKNRSIDFYEFCKNFPSSCSFQA